MKTGTKVGASRWAYSAAHVDCWLKPWAGVVLDRADPRAWTDTLAFRGRPTRAQVLAHLATLGDNPIPTHVPVLWDFGEHGPKVHWERVEELRTYAADVAAWESERTAKMAGNLGIRLAV